MYYEKSIKFRSENYEDSFELSKHGKSRLRLAREALDEKLFGHTHNFFMTHPDEYEDGQDGPVDKKGVGWDTCGSCGVRRPTYMNRPSNIKPL